MSRRYKAKDAEGGDFSGALEYFGKALLHFADTGKTEKLKRSVIPLRSVAEGIIAIARGEDARKVFGQGAIRGNAGMPLENHTRAFVYWLSRVDHPQDIDRAVRLAQKHFTYLPEPSRASILRVARRHRDEVLNLLDRVPIEGRGKVDTSALRQHLAIKSHRGRF